MDMQAASPPQCALLQAAPKIADGVLTTGASLPFDYAGRHGARARSAYGPGARITCVDRAVVRRHFAESQPVPAIATQKHRRKSARHWPTDSLLPLQAGAKLLPAELEDKLSALQPGYKRLLVGDDVVLIESATRRIVDVMPNASGASKTGAA